MSESQFQHARLERFYAAAMRLYPPPFREAFAPAMRQAFHDALLDRSLSRRTLIPLVLRDLVTSLAKEHLSTARETFSRPALLFNALVLGALATGLAFALNAIPQQVLRLGANDPQIAMATDVATALEQGNRNAIPQPDTLPALAGGAGKVDIARSLSPFVIVYDDRGQPLASQAQLNGKIPVPPSGVFSYVRTHQQDRISWQPVLGRDNGVRIAAVIQRVDGPHPGFVLAGRNMREVESREALVGQLAGLTWIGMLGVILVGTLVFGWFSRPKTA
jgi:hypothetical protein